MIDPVDITAARRALGVQLAACREAAGLIQKQLAASVNYERSSVANVETGRQKIPRRFWVACDQVLDTGTALTDAYDELEALVKQQRAEAARLPHVAGRSGLQQGRDIEHEPRSAANADDTLLAVVVNGHSVMLPLGAAAATIARTSTSAPAQTRGRGERSWERALIANVATGDERAYELFVRGHGLLGSNDRRDIDTAHDLLERAVGRDPRFARAIAARGYARWRQYFAGWASTSSTLTNALRDVNAALDVDPDSVFAHMTFIRACWDMGWHERALEAGRSIHRRNPESLDATIAYARALTNAGLAHYALPLVGSVLAVDPTNPAALKLNVWCCLMVGDHAHALEVARGYLARHIGDANTRWAVALASQNVPGGGHAAIRIACGALEADPGDVTLWVLLGYLHRMNGDEVSALEAWSTGLKKAQSEPSHVSNARTEAWIANLQAAVGDTESALRITEELAEAHPTNGYLLYRLCHVLAEIGHLNGAVQMLDSAISNGFLSAQILRQEESLGLSKLRHLNDYAVLVRRLDANVERCRRAHATHLPVAADKPN